MKFGYIWMCTGVKKTVRVYLKQKQPLLQPEPNQVTPEHNKDITTGNFLFVVNRDMYFIVFNVQYTDYFFFLFLVYFLFLFFFLFEDVFVSPS